MAAIYETKICKLSTLDTPEPVAKRHKSIVKYGKTLGEDRGTNLMGTAIEKPDEYYWLRDDKRENKDVLQYLTDENTYTESTMKVTKELQETVYKEIKSRIKEDDTTYPYSYGSGGMSSVYKYYKQMVADKSYPIYCRKNTVTMKDEIILDVNELAMDKKHCDVVNVNMSYDHQILAFAVDYNGSEKYDVLFKDLSTNKLLDNKLSGLLFATFDWSPDCQSIYYCATDRFDRVSKVLQYDMKTMESQLLFEESDPLFSANFNISEDGKYLFIESSSADTSECYYINLETKDDKLKLIHPRTDGLQYSVNSHNGNFIIHTNKDNAVNFKLMITSTENPTIDNWVDMREYVDTEYISQIICFSNHVAVLLRSKCFKSIAIISYDRLNNKYSSDWKFFVHKEPIYTTSFSTNYVYDTDKLWFTYTSLTRANILYEYDMVNNTTTELYEKTVPNYDPTLYESKLIFVPSYYGESVPVSMVYRKDKRTMTPQPLYLYAYGSYGLCCDPTFNSEIVSLLDWGFIYATAHIRGGSEKGYKWFLDGKMYTKMNTFLDFITCSEYLIRENYTKPELLTIEGRSAGGLLMGAVITMRPDLYKNVIMGVPFVDVLTTMADPSIPLTTGEWIQWGNPNKIEDYTYMKQYSPYDNIKCTSYPNTLILAGLHDPRVPYWEPAKFMAKLRFMKKDKNVHLLKTEMNQGHFGGSDRYKHIKETAFIYAFVLASLNL